MRTTRPPGLAALLLGASLAALPAGAQVAPVHVDASNLHSLQGRLDGFAGGLRADERALWNRLLLRAASAPAGGSEVRVQRVLPIGPGGGCDGGGTCDGTSRVAIIVQGGRTAAGGAESSPANGIIVQGGRTAQGAGTRVGGRPGAGVRPTDAVSIGPKQEDPTRPAPESLARRLTEFSRTLPAEERGALEWMLTRAATVPEGRPATPGGLPPGAAVASNPEGQPRIPMGVPAGGVGVPGPRGNPGPGGLPEGMASVSLRQALGVDALSIGPKQEDPTRAPPKPETRWIVRY
jgi:hypothetical protein